MLIQKNESIDIIWGNHSMKKHLYVIGGTMGAGKTTVCNILKKKLKNSVFLDGDWCWDMEPFWVTEETKAMVMDNITHVLNNFLACSVYDHVIFCWVLHEQEILDTLLSRLDCRNAEVHLYSLLLDEKSLEERLKKDIRQGLRQKDVLERSIWRLPLYEKLHTEKIYVSGQTPEETAAAILRAAGIKNDYEKEKSADMERETGKINEKKTAVSEDLESLKKELEAYRKMHRGVRQEYESIVRQMEKQKEAGRTKSATYRQLMGRKLTYGTMLDLYKLYDLED